MSDGMLFIEGFEGDEDSLVWTDFMLPDTGQGRLQSAARTGNWGLRAGQSGVAWSSSPLWTATDHVICGFAFKCNDQAPTGSAIRFFENWGVNSTFWTWIGLTEQMTLFSDMSQDGLGMPGLPRHYSTFQLDVDTWYYIEISLQASAGGNILTIQVNGPAGAVGSTGAEVLQHIGPAPAMANNAYNQFRVGAWNQGADYSFDDFYVREGAEGYLGDTQVVLLDLEDDRSVDFTRSSGAKNYLMVNEVDTDDDSTYNEIDTTGEDIFEIADQTFTGQIHCVQLITRARKTDADVFSLTPTLDLDGVRAYEGTRFMAASYETAPPAVFWDAPGKTGWTLADLNAVGVGYLAEDVGS